MLSVARHTSTRRRVLETAARLFQRQGYAATGLKQVLTGSGAPKGSPHFPFPRGQGHLAAESITISGTRVGEQMAAIVSAAEDPAGAISGLANLFAANLSGSGFHSGCPVATVALEAAADSEAIRSRCESVYGARAEGLSVALERWGLAARVCLPVAAYHIRRR